MLKGLVSVGWRLLGNVRDVLEAVGDRLWQMPFAAWLGGTRPGLDWHDGECGNRWGISNGALNGGTGNIERRMGW